MAAIAETRKDMTTQTIPARGMRRRITLARAGRRTAPAAALMLLLATVPAAQEADDGSAGEIIVDPERVIAEVAPVDVAVRGLPTLPPPEYVAPPEPVVTQSPEPAEELAPPDVPRETIATTVTDIGGDQVYFNATLGAGSVSSVLGSINVYRLGDGPQFRLGYDHRGADGFNFTAPGSGFFTQENALDTWIRLGNGGPATAEITAGYTDRRFGLQQLPTYYSADGRTVSAAAELAYRPDPRSSATFQVAYEDRQRVLATTAADVDAPREIYRTVQPELRGRVEWPRFNAAVAAAYHGFFPAGTPVDSASSVGLTLALEGVPFDGLTLSADAATWYRFTDRAYFPVEGALEYRGADRWNLTLRGGYRVEDLNPASRWERYTVTTLADEVDGMLPRADAVFAGGALEVVVIPGSLETTIGLDWDRRRNDLVVEPYDDDPSIAAHPVRLDARERLDGSVGLRMPVGERTILRADWDARFRDRGFGEPHHQVSAAVERDGDPVSVLVEGAVPIDGAAATPILGGEVRYQIARDVDVTLFGRDLLGPIEDRGRTEGGLAPRDGDPLIVPGFEIGLSVRVSF